MIPSVKESLYGTDEMGHTIEAPSANRLVGEYAKPDFYHVHPGSSGGSEVKVKPPVPLEPLLHLFVLMSAIVVQNQMHVESLGHRGVEGIQKLAKL